MVPVLAMVGHLLKDAVPELQLAVMAGLALTAFPQLLPAVLGRGALWFCFMGLAAMGLFLEMPEGDPMVRYLASVASLAWALVVLGRPVAGRGDVFAPSAFGATLTAGLILGGADVFWLFAGTYTSTRGHEVSPAWVVTLASLGVLVLAALWGTVRLRVWGVLLGVACNVTLVTLMGHQAATLRGDNRIGVLILCAGAAVHLLLQAPVLWDMVVGHPPAWATRPLRHTGGAVVLLVFSALVIRAATLPVG